MNTRSLTFICRHYSNETVRIALLVRRDPIITKPLTEFEQGYLSTRDRDDRIQSRGVLPEFYTRKGTVQEEILESIKKEAPLGGPITINSLQKDEIQRLNVRIETKNDLPTHRLDRNPSETVFLSLDATKPVFPSTIVEESESLLQAAQRLAADMKDLNVWIIGKVPIAVDNKTFYMRARLLEGSENPQRHWLVGDILQKNVCNSLYPFVVAMTQQNNVDALEVGWLFVQEYYTFLNKEPQRLHCFYNKQSYLTHGHEGEQVRLCHGQQEIHDRIMELGLNDCRVLVSNVDSQASLNGGIIVQVLGELSNNNGPSHKFAQTFFLAEQPNGFYVHNDIFRFLKEDIDHPFEETKEPIVEVAKPIVEKKEVPKPVSPQKPVEKVSEVKKAPSPAIKPAKPEPKQPETAPAKEPARQNGTPAQPPVAAPPKPVEASAKPPVAPSSPAKPKTWANLAATGVDKFTTELSPAKGQVLNGTAAKEEKSDDQRPASGRRNDKNQQRNDQNGYRQNQNFDEKDKSSVYLKNLPESVTEKDLTEVFSKVGQVKYANVNSQKRSGFVAFTTEDAAQGAIGKSFTIKDVTIVAEERRRPRNRSGNNRSGRGNNSAGDRPAGRGNRNGNNNRSDNNFRGGKNQVKSLSNSSSPTN